MKTHELARGLMAVAKWLRSGPDIELHDLEGPRTPIGPREHSQPEAVALSVLVGFSRFTKQQWAELIEEHSIPVRVLSTYSARDVMGKIMKYFSENPEARRRLMDRVDRQPGKASPELMRALASLLGS